MARKEENPKGTKEKVKTTFWKIVGYAILAVGALAVINHLAR